MANDLLLQQEWLTYQKVAFQGQVGSQPGACFIKGPVNTESSGTKPQPGYPVYFNTTRERFEVPKTAAQIRKICGIVTYYKSSIKNASGVIEFDDDTLVDIMIRGSIWVKSGAAIKRTELITWDGSDSDWVKGSIPTISAAPTQANVNALIAELGYTRIGNYSPKAIASGELFEAFLSGGIIAG